MKHKIDGFVVEPRDIIDCEWYSDAVTMHLYRHCRLRANHSNTMWRGLKIKRGQFITSLKTLSEETGLSVMQVRTSIDKLVKTGYITNKSTNKNRIITYINYDKEQASNKQVNKANNKQSNKQTEKQQTNNKQVNKQSNKQITTDNKNYYLKNNNSLVKDKKSASEPCALGERRSAACVTLRDIREFQIDNKLGDGDTTSTFFHGFDDSGTAFPENWKSIYERYANAEPGSRSKFLTELKQGKYKERWGSADEGT